MMTDWTRQERLASIVSIDGCVHLIESSIDVIRESSHRSVQIGLELDDHVDGVLQLLHPLIQGRYHLQRGERHLEL